MDRAIKSETVNIGQRLLDYGTVGTIEDEKGWALLYEAMNNENEHTARRFLRYGADVNAIRLYGSAPVQITTDTGDISIIKIVIAHRADLNTPIHGGKTTLHLALDQNAPAVVLIEPVEDFLVTNNTDKAPLKYVLHSNEEEMARFILRQRKLAALNFQHQWGSSLHEATRQKNFGIFQELIQSEAPCPIQKYGEERPIFCEC